MSERGEGLAVVGSTDTPSRDSRLAKSFAAANISPGGESSGPTPTEGSAPYTRIW